MSAHELGEVVTCSADFTAVPGGFDVELLALTFKLRDPAGVITTKEWGTDDEVVEDDVGQYHVDVTGTQSARWYYRFVGSNAVDTAVLEGYFDVNGSVFADDTDGVSFPSVDDVGVRMFARTRVSGSGALAGTFTDQTKVPATQVKAFIDDAASMVTARIGLKVPFEYWPLVRAAIVARTAMSIERAFFPEPSDTADGAYQSWVQEYAAVMGQLVAALEATILSDDPPAALRLT